jgi:hypothetical protein
MGLWCSMVSTPPTKVSARDTLLKEGSERFDHWTQPSALSLPARLVMLDQPRTDERLEVDRRVCGVEPEELVRVQLAPAKPSGDKIMSQRYSMLGLPRRYSVTFLPSREFSHYIRKVETDDCGGREVTILNSGYHSYKQAKSACARLTRSAHCRPTQAAIVRYYPIEKEAFDGRS